MGRPKRYGRRANREGTLFKRKSDRRWCAMYTLPDGKRRTVYATKSDNTREAVSKLLREALGAIEQGRAVPAVIRWTPPTPSGMFQPTLG